VTDPSIKIIKPCNSQMKTSSLKRLQLFGLPCFVLDVQAVPLAASRPMQLLVHLAVNGVWHGRDHVAQLFWPDRTHKIARSNLRNLLSKVPDAAPFAAMESRPHALRWHVPSDLADFETALQVQDWPAAVRIGATELLQGFEVGASEPYLQWLQAERDARLDQWKKAVQALLAQPATALEEREALADAWAARCPLDEDAVHARVSLAHERHHRAAAVKIYRAFETKLRDDLAVRPSLQLERLALSSAPSLVKSYHTPPTPGVAPAASTALPTRTQMVGRRLELRQLTALLNEGAAQLITVTGPGGVGKSTLLAAFHRQWVEGGGADVFLIDVSAAPSARAAVAAVAAALGVSSPPGVPEEETLADALADRRWLLMIDGAEQAGMATPLARLLERCPLTRCLIASRQRLHLDNEYLLVLDGFPLPDAEEADAELLAGNDGVRFLADVIANAGRPVDMAADATSMAAIVRAVDGLPLALKLLGKLTHLYSLRQLLDSVQHPPDSGARPANALEVAELLPSLLASFQRSWLSLSPAQQAVLARLAMFPADFEIAAGRWVAKTELPVITSLVDRSLLRAQGAGRLSLHAAVRSCVQAVCPQPAADAVAAYLVYYVQRLRALASLAKTKTVRPLQQFLYAEIVHVSRAWALALERRDHGTLLSLLESVWFLDDGTSTLMNFSTWCTDAERLTRDDPKVPKALRAMLLAGIAHDAFQQRQMALASNNAELAIRAAEGARHPDSTLWAQDTLAWMSGQQGNFRQAASLAARQVSLLGNAGIGEGLSVRFVLYPRATLSSMRGDLQTSLEQYEEAANAAHQFEDFHCEFVCLMFMAGAHHNANMSDRATQLEERALAAGAAGKVDPALIASYLCAFTHWNIHNGNTERAQAHMQRADALVCGHPQSRNLRLKVHSGHAAVLTAQGDLAAARPHLGEVVDAISREQIPLVSNTLFLTAGKWFLAAGDRDACVGVLREVRLGSGSARDVRDFKAAQTMLRELGEKPLDADLPQTQSSNICVAAAVAKRHMMQLVLRPPAALHGAVASNMML
jgi:DNA-binding SARP family transcriptional activator